MSTPRGAAKGLFKYQGPAMPCEPHDIIVERYVFPRTFGREEREEAAARVLAYSQDFNLWVGVSMSRLVADMDADRKQQDGKGPVSLVYLHKSETIIHGLRELVEEKLLKHVGIGEGDEGMIFFPQPAMIEKILQAQRVRSRQE